MTSVVGCIYFVLDHWGRGEAAIEIYQRLPAWALELSGWIAPFLFILAVFFFELQRRSSKPPMVGKKWKSWKFIAFCGVTSSLTLAAILIVILPKVSMEILGSRIGHVDADVTPVTSVVFRLEVKNSGPSTTLDGWDVVMKLVNGKSSKGLLAPPSNLVMDFHGSPFVSRVPQSDLIQEETGREPIKTGATVPGYIAFLFPGFSPEIVNFPGTTFILSYRDVSRRGYTAKYVVPAESYLLPTH